MDDKTHVLKSSLLSSYTYDSSTQDLTVTFKSGDSWLYKKVMPDVMSSVFDKPGSVGSRFLSIIKRGNYQATQQD